MIEINKVYETPESLDAIAKKIKALPDGAQRTLACEIFGMTWNYLAKRVNTGKETTLAGYYGVVEEEVTNEKENT